MSLNNVITFKRGVSPHLRFESLLRPHFDALYAAARRMASSQSDAEDLVQEVSIKAFLKIDQFEQVSYQRAWLLKMLYHQFIDMHRSTQRSPFGNSDTGADSLEPEQIAESDWRPEQMVDREMHMTQILRAMKCLNRDQCAMVALHDIEGVTLDELHAMTGLALGTIKSQLHRTRVKLGRLLSNETVMTPRLNAVGGKS